MSQDTESTVIIDKNEMYKELLQKVLPFIKSENKIIKKAAYDFNVLLKCAINDINSETLEYLNDGIQHAIEYFSQELSDLINNRIDPNVNINDVHYGLLNDISKVIMRQILFKNQLSEFREYLLGL